MNSESCPDISIRTERYESKIRSVRHVVDEHSRAQTICPGAASGQAEDLAATRFPAPQLPVGPYGYFSGPG
jgi:hypothetical protein